MPTHHEVARMGQGRRAGRAFQRRVVQAVRGSRGTMMTASAGAMEASMTRVRRSLRMAGFSKPRSCQERVRWTTRRAPGLTMPETMRRAVPDVYPVCTGEVPAR